jgi:predicted Zn-ribbon and HTH transcriptional regulator
MKTARCLKCGFKMLGRFKNGAPKACPACGYTDSEKDLKKLGESKMTTPQGETRA